MIKVAIVGCGRISHRHVMVINESPYMKLVGVCDVISEKVSGFCSQYDVEGYTDIIVMLKDVGPDIAVICTEAGNHASNVITCSGWVENIITEKPMALTIEDANAMIECCEEDDTKLFVVKQNRYNLPVLKLREALEKGRFGKLYLGTIRLRWHRDQNYFDMDGWRGTWKMDGGVLASQASHHVDLLQWMMGPVKWVFAQTATMSLDIEVDDIGVVLLGFENGALGVIEATNAAQPENLEGSISILGDGGTVVIDGFAVNKMDTWKFKKFDKMDNNIMEFSENPKTPDGKKDVYGFGHKRFYDNVIKNIREGKGTVIDGEEGRKSLELISAIYQSSATGQKVFLKKESKLGQ